VEERAGELGHECQYRGGVCWRIHARNAKIYSFAIPEPDPDGAMARHSGQLRWCELIRHKSDNWGRLSTEPAIGLPRTAGPDPSAARRSPANGSRPSERDGAIGAGSRRCHVARHRRPGVPRDRRRPGPHAARATSPADTGWPGAVAALTTASFWCKMMNGARPEEGAKSRLRLIPFGGGGPPDQRDAPAMLPGWRAARRAGESSGHGGGGPIGLAPPVGGSGNAITGRAPGRASLSVALVCGPDRAFWTRRFEMKGKGQLKLVAVVLGIGLGAGGPASARSCGRPASRRRRATWPVPTSTASRAGTPRRSWWAARCRRRARSPPPTPTAARSLRVERRADHLGLLPPRVRTADGRLVTVEYWFKHGESRHRQHEHEPSFISLGTARAASPAR